MPNPSFICNYIIIVLKGLTWKVINITAVGDFPAVQWLGIWLSPPRAWVMELRSCKPPRMAKKNNDNSSNNKKITAISRELCISLSGSC